MSDASDAHRGLGLVHPDLAFPDVEQILPDRQGHPVHQDHASTAGQDESDLDKLVAQERG